MPDVKTEIRQFATKEEAKVKAWWQSHWVTFAAGIAVAELVRWFIHHL